MKSSSWSAKTLGSSTDYNKALDSQSGSFPTESVLVRVPPRTTHPDSSILVGGNSNTHLVTTTCLKGTVLLPRGMRTSRPHPRPPANAPLDPTPTLDDDDEPTLDVENIGVNV